MSFFHRPLDDLTEEDLQDLVKNQVREGRTIEYKEQLPGNSDGDKREFRFDVCSFANAAGGDIVYGMIGKRDKGASTGEPAKLNPLSVNPDMENLRLLQVLQTQIDPRIPGVRVHFIKLTGGDYACIVRIPKSWMGLHGVQVNGSPRFYSRTSAGRYPLDVSEIRAGFVAAESGYERLRKFRLERIGRIVANETPVDVAEGPKVILHVLPFSMLDPTIEWDIHAVRDDQTFAPIGSSGWSHEYNFDGVVKYAERMPSWSYVQFFRNGAVEACVTRFFDADTKRLTTGLEHYMIDAVGRYLKSLGKVGIAEPLALALTLVGSAVTP